MTTPTAADILRDLARVRCEFQLRAITAALGLPAHPLHDRSHDLTQRGGGAQSHEGEVFDHGETSC